MHTFALICLGGHKGEQKASHSCQILDGINLTRGGVAGGKRSLLVLIFWGVWSEVWSGLVGGGGNISELRSFHVMTSYRLRDWSVDGSRIRNHPCMFEGELWSHGCAR